MRISPSKSESMVLIWKSIERHQGMGTRSCPDWWSFSISWSCSWMTKKMEQRTDTQSAVLQASTGMQSVPMFLPTSPVSPGKDWKIEITKKSSWSEFLSGFPLRDRLRRLAILEWPTGPPHCVPGTSNPNEEGKYQEGPRIGDCLSLPAWKTPWDSHRRSWPLNFF